MRSFVIFLILALSMRLVLTQMEEAEIGDENPGVIKFDVDSGLSRTTDIAPSGISPTAVLNEQDSIEVNDENDELTKSSKTKYYDAEKLKITRMENFLHNYMNKLERLLRPLKNEHIADRYKRLAQAYFKRLSQDTINEPKGFQMGDLTIELLDLSNYVLDTVDISEMKKAGVLKNFLLNQVKKNKPTKKEKKQKDKKENIQLSVTNDDREKHSAGDYGYED
ncbi:hypothetical protein ACKWTF_006154 [Chironomus riparius]